MSPPTVAPPPKVIRSVKVKPGAPRVLNHDIVTTSGTEDASVGRCGPAYLFPVRFWAHAWGRR